MKLAWNDSLSVGIDEIDDDHKLIFQKYNVFVLSCSEGHGGENLQDLLWFLSSYVATHFAREERLMERVAYADAARHYKSHTKFVRQVDELMGRFVEEGPSENLISTVRGVVKEWLMDHIQVSDRALGDHIKEQGVRLA